MKELKAILRSLVISNAERGLNVSQLNQDFKRLEGSCIPFREHGFQSLEAMLRTMTDVVKVLGTGVSATIYPITTKKNEHILAMVEKSKKNRKNVPKINHPYVRKASSNLPPRPRGNFYTKRDTNNCNGYNGNQNGNGRAASTFFNLPNNANQQFNTFGNPVQPMFNMQYGPNTTQQAWGNQYGYQNNCNGNNQQRYWNNNQWQTNNSRWSTPHCANNYDSGYYSDQYYYGNGNGCFSGSFSYNDGCQQNYGYSSYSYNTFQANTYNGSWECNYSSYYGYNNGCDHHTNFVQGMGPYYY